jgi:hypothetical protein
MSTQHTPGPWIGAGPSFGDPLPRYTTSIVTEWEDDAEGCIDICELPFHHHDDENEANARLIAAAPDLLEALLEYKRLYEEVQPTGGWQGVYETGNAAIAKAVGDEA